MATSNESAQNNQLTAAEYQAAADEITAIVNAQRAELLIPLEAQQELLRNRQELLITRQQSALNTLQAAEADPGDTAFLEASRTAYARATGEVNATSLAIQQNRSVLAQSRQSTAELQEQRGRLETNADLAAKGAPTLNSLPPPATTVPAQSPSYVPPPEPPVQTQISAIPQPAAPVPPAAPSAQNNVSVAQQWGETELEISSTARGIRAENAAIAANINSLQSQGAAAARIDRALENQVIDARLAGASDLEISQIETLQIQAVARTADITNQIRRQESVLTQNQETLDQLQQQRFIAEEAQLTASSGTPGLISVPPPATVVPGQDPAAYDLPPQTYAQNFQAGPVLSDGDEALTAFEQAQLAQQEGRAFPPVDDAAPVGDEALQAIEDAQAAELAAAEGSAFAEPAPVNPELDEQLAQSTQSIEDTAAAELAAREGSAFATPVSTEGDEALAAFDRAQAEQAAQATPPDGSFDRQEATKLRAKQQSTLQARVNVPSAADWRVRLQLAKSADYLYRADTPGILQPLVETDGVIFPYTPQIDSSYKANYDPYDLIHSNYRGYFYKSSSVTELGVKGTFTAQDTREAQYLLAVIHFFRSVTKMFYGKDTQRGVPPPLVYLSAYGQYQYNRHPCLVTNFSYNLPTDVDYIRADGFNNYGVNLENRQSRSSGPAPGGAISFVRDKLKNNGLFPGGMAKPPAPPAVTQNVNNTNPVNSTYVPTRMDISITLLPVQTRSQVSKQFSLQSFANGDLLKGGFW